MIDTSVSTLLATLALDLLAFVVLYFVWNTIKNKRSKELDPEYFDNTELPMIEEQKLRAWQIWNKVFKAKDTEILAARKPEALVYLKLHKRLILSFSILVVLGCGALIPVYVQGDNFEELTKTVTIGNILDNPDYVIDPLLCMFVFSIILYLILIKSYRDCMKYQQTNRCTLEQRSLEITRFNANISMELAEWMIQDKCNSIISGSVEQVKVAPDWTKLYRLLHKMKELRQDIKYYKEVNERKGKRAKILSGLQRVDAVEKLESDEKELKKKIVASEIAKDKNASFAVVTCVNAEVAQNLLKGMKKKKGWGFMPIQNDPILSWQVKRAANPNDIIWKNVCPYPQGIGCSNRCKNLSVILILLFIFTPTLFVTITADALGGLGLALEIIIVNLPALILLLYMDVLVPCVIAGMVKREKHYRRSEAVASSVNKYLQIKIFLVFGVGIIGLETIGIMLRWEWEDWLPTFAEQIIQTGDFYTVLMMQMTFIGQGFGLLGLSKWIKGVARAKISKTERQKKRAWRLEPWDLGKEYSQTCIVFIVCLSYSLIVPYMVIIALIYFCIKYIYNKNLLMTVYVIEYDSFGRVAQVIYRALLICISIFWFISGVLLIISAETVYITIGTVIIVASVVSVVLILCFDSCILNLGKKVKDCESEKSLLERENDYIHPCLLRMEGDPFTLN